MKRLIYQIFVRLRRPLIPCFLMLFVLTDTITVQWLPNSESDLAGYRLHYGTASRLYSQFIKVGLTTAYSLKNLKGGYEYFFAVSAYDSTGNESLLSEEVTIAIEGEQEIFKSETEEKVYNFPNPFNPEKQLTQIRYVLHQSEQVTIIIFDVGGNKVKTLLKDIFKNQGEHTEDIWDGRDEDGNPVPNGIYYTHVKSKSLDHYVTMAVAR